MLDLTKDRLDPDVMLKAITQEEQKKSGAKLYIFLGMAPGVGKTYAMLLAAHEALKEGKDVVAGVIETHGRNETAALIAGISAIPKKENYHRGIELLEMDLDAILERKPKLVLVDELAHTNAPGSRHSKRWQDVFEILDAGIDVFTTLNVQHLESRKNAVERISGINIRETVPDGVLDRAYQIRLIDLAPADLLKRLRDGKVYQGEKSGLAAGNFFKEHTLTALREVSLRLTAERVDYDLQNLSAGRTDSDLLIATDRLLVPFSHHDDSEELLRTARRLAYNLEAPWTAVHVDTGSLLHRVKQAALAKNLELARNLGAEVISITAPDPVKALVRIAQQKHVTQILMGDSSPLLKRIMQEARGINIYMVRTETLPCSKRLNIKEYFKFNSPVLSYVKAIGTVSLLTSLGSFLVSFLGYQSIGFVFLMSVLALGFFVSLGPILFAAILSCLSWNYFFIPPIFTLYIRETQDIFMCVSYLISALAVGILTRKIKKQESILITREERSRILYEIAWDIATASHREDLIPNICARIGNFLGGECEISLKTSSGTLKPFAKMHFSKPEQEMSTALWVLDRTKPAGLSTQTLSGSEAIYIPLAGSQDTLGVFAFRPGSHNPHLSQGNLDLLFTVVRELTVFFERELFREQVSQAMRIETPISYADAAPQSFAS